MITVCSLSLCQVVGRSLVKMSRKNFYYMKLYYAILDREKAFDLVYRNVLWWAISKPNIPEWNKLRICKMVQEVKSGLMDD